MCFQADDNGGTAKGENPEFDRLMFPVLDAAQKHGIELAVHIEPYEGRDHMTVRRDLIYIADRCAILLLAHTTRNNVVISASGRHCRYGSHPALHRYGDGGLPVIYLYDSYRTPARYVFSSTACLQWMQVRWRIAHSLVRLANRSDWAKVFGESGSYTVRGTESDAFIIGLAVERKHLADIRDSGFDGVYTCVTTNKVGASQLALSLSMPTRVGILLRTSSVMEAHPRTGAKSKLWPALRRQPVEQETNLCSSPVWDQVILIRQYDLGTVRIRSHAKGTCCHAFLVSTILATKR